MFGESMFSMRTDASKIALAALVGFCRCETMPLIDCQQATSHLASLGAEPVARAQFEAEAHALTMQSAAPPWAYHSGIWDALGLHLDEIRPSSPAFRSTRPL